MIVCSMCKRFVKDIDYMINGNGDIKDVFVVCKKHGRIEAYWETYEEVVGAQNGGADAP